MYDAAVAAGVRRVVFASGNHVTGFYPWGRPRPVRPTQCARTPTTRLSKAVGEDLGRVFHERFGIEVVNLRIGGFADEPRGPWLRSGWLSFGDAVRLVTAALTAPDVGFLTCYGVSANTRPVHMPARAGTSSATGRSTTPRTTRRPGWTSRR